MYGCKCKRTFFVGEKVGACINDVIEFPFLVPETGEYSLSLNFLSTDLTIKKSFTAGEKFSFPTSGLNKSYDWVGIIYDPSGKRVYFTDVHDTQFDSVFFSTSNKVQL